ncbi:hypothetical protein [Vibrio sp. 1S139]|uniref:hypothetical protein n=1 Tax=Vibrio sp. 1S139 TaxID=3230006 RepID=UPI00352C4F10
MIKNWTVITQPVKFGSKGVASRERYLTSKNHPNHKNTTEIHSIIGDEYTSRYIDLIGEQYRLRQQMGRKPGRHLSSFAMEYCLTLPKDVATPNNEQWNKVINYCCTSLFNICNLEEQDKYYFKKNIRAVLHRQNKNISTGSGDHVHLIIGKVLAGKNTRILKELQQKKATKALKTAFNIAVLKYIGLNFRDYTPSELRKFKKLEIWKHYQSKDLENLKNIERIQKQVDKWFSAFAEKDNRQFNRINKSYLSLVNSSSYNSQETINKLEESLNQIEVVSGRKFKR